MASNVLLTSSNRSKIQGNNVVSSNELQFSCKHKFLNHPDTTEPATATFSAMELRVKEGRGVSDEVG